MKHTNFKREKKGEKKKNNKTQSHKEMIATISPHIHKNQRAHPKAEPTKKNESPTSPYAVAVHVKVTKQEKPPYTTTNFLKGQQNHFKTVFVISRYHMLHLNSSAN